MLCGRAVLVVGVASGTAACGEELALEEPAPLVEHFADGQRLRAQYFEFQGGAKLFRRFFDTVLGEACEFDGLIGPSGADTCLPVSAVTKLLPSHDFADPACTVPVIFITAVEPPPSLVVVMPSNACDAEPTVFELGARVAPHYERASDGSCSEFPAPGHGLGAPVGLDTFVSAIAERDVAAGRIGALTLVGADGSRQILAGWDAERQESVVESGEVPPDRWTPRGVAYGDSGVFSDASCAQPVAVKSGHSARCPVTTVLEDPLNAAGARLDPLSLFARDDAGACAARGDVWEGHMYFDIGEPIAVEAFAELKLVEQGSGRVRRRDAASPEGIGILPTNRSPLLDTTTNQPCEVLTASDGVARCLPQVFDGGWFADAACTQPLVQAAEPPGALVTIADYDLANALPTYVVRHVGMPYMAALLYAGGPSGCTGVPYVDGFGYFSLGEPVAPAEFEAAIVHD